MFDIATFFCTFLHYEYSRIKSASLYTRVGINHALGMEGLVKLLSRVDVDKRTLGTKGTIEVSAIIRPEVILKCAF